MWLLTLFLNLCTCPSCDGDWGFFGHRMINKHAVYAIPPPANQFFKQHIGWLEEHGVDADKRRYAVPHEYKNHYIDLDFLEERQDSLLTNDLKKEILKNLIYKVINSSGDTITLSKNPRNVWTGEKENEGLPDSVMLLISLSAIDAEPYEERWIWTIHTVDNKFSAISFPESWQKMIILDDFSVHGILPYWIQAVYRRLVSAFMDRDIPRILRLCADLGHYIGDAHVPLHTTINYNGQLTGQHGIHGFWESRIPELFFDSYDLVTGPAVYIDDISKVTWTIVRESHAFVKPVLEMEQKVRQNMPEDLIMCYEDRLSTNVLTYCREFADQYAKAMDGMVEERFRKAIHMIASFWYSAWVEAGQPPLWDSVVTPSQPVVEKSEETPVRETPYGRPHE